MVYLQCIGQFRPLKAGCLQSKLFHEILRTAYQQLKMHDDFTPAGHCARNST